jgi:hypothetical protein
VREREEIERERKCHLQLPTTFMPYFSTRKKAGRVTKFCMGSQVTQILGFQYKKKLGTPPAPALWNIWADRGGILKSCPRVPKLRIWLLSGWGRCLKVTLQTCAAENFRSCRWGDERTVKRAQKVSEAPIGASGNQLIATFGQVTHEWPVFGIVFQMLLWQRTSNFIENGKQPQFCLYMAS